MLKWFIIGILAFCIIFPGVAKLAWDWVMIKTTGRASVQGATTGAAVGGQSTQNQSPLIMGLGYISNIVASNGAAGGLTTGTTAVTNP